MADLIWPQLTMLDLLKTKNKKPEAAKSQAGMDFLNSLISRRIATGNCHSADKLLSPEGSMILFHPHTDLFTLSVLKIRLYG